MFTEQDLTRASRVAAVAELETEAEIKRAFSTNYAAMNNGAMGHFPRMDLNSYRKPNTFGDSFKHIGHGMLGMVGHPLQAAIGGHNGPGMLENFSSHLLRNPTTPGYAKELFSPKNITEPLRRAMPSFRESAGEVGAPVTYANKNWLRPALQDFQQYWNTEMPPNTF